MHRSQVELKKYLRRWTTSSAKIQVWTTFCLHPNLCKSISKWDHKLAFLLSLQSMSTMCTDPGYLDTPSWNPDCWLGHVSNPRILPGNIKVYSWPAYRRKATINDWWEVAAHPLSTIQGGPSVPSHRNLCLEMKLILDIINMLALVKECCGVNHWTLWMSKYDNRCKITFKMWYWLFACVGNLLVVGTLQYSHSGGKERFSFLVVEEMPGNISCFFCFPIVSLWVAPGERRCQRRTPSSRSLPPLTATMSQDDVLCKKVLFEVDLLAKNRFCATNFRCKH